MSASIKLNGKKFPLSDEEYDFIERNDLWVSLKVFAHEWDIDNDPGAWDMMIECFVPFMTNGTTRK